MPQSNNQQFIACAAIFNSKGEILLSQRYNPSNPVSHMHWQFPGGGIEYGENPDEAVIRELKEELGLDIAPISKRPLVVTSHTFEESGDYICLIIYGFRLEEYSLKPDLDEETNAVKWFRLDELSNTLLLPKNLEIAHQAWEAFKDLA